MAAAGRTFFVAATDFLLTFVGQLYKNRNITKNIKIKMEITGKIIAALPEVSGVSRSGNAWKKKEYVLETQETYPRKVHFTCFGDNADKIVLSVGQTATVSFDIESREYNGRWYTDIRAWKAEIAQAPAAQPAAPAASPFDAGVAVPPPPIVNNSAEEEFPF